MSLEPEYIQADSGASYPDHLIQPKVPVTETIYWALQDNNNDGDYEKLIISDHEVTGSDNYQGSFAGNTQFSNCLEVPWCNSNIPYTAIGIKLEEIKIEGIVAPTSTASWFEGAGLNSQTITGNIGDLNVSNVTNMSGVFYMSGYNATTWSIGDLSKWDTSKVTNMNYMFSNAGQNATTWSIGDLSKWDTSKVTSMTNMFHSVGNRATTFNLGLSDWDTSNVVNMHGMFSSTGSNATTWSIGDLSNWDTSNVTDMSYMFYSAGKKDTTWSIGDLSNWDTSKVTNMNSMFYYAGYSASTFELDLSGWDTSQVTDMSNMFTDAGYNATTWRIKIPSTNGGGINNTTTNLYGSNTSKYASPNSGRQFTLV